MSATISAATGKPYGIQRVCDTWEMPRSSFYDRKARAIASPVPLKRGPKTLVSDAELLALIREDIATSLFTGEGHRKVWGRIRFVKGIKVGRKRVLRLMRQRTCFRPIGPFRVKSESTRAKSSPWFPTICGGPTARRFSP